MNLSIPNRPISAGCIHNNGLRMMTKIDFFHNMEFGSFKWMFGESPDRRYIKSRVRYASSSLFWLYSYSNIGQNSRRSASFRTRTASSELSKCPKLYFLLCNRMLACHYLPLSIKTNAPNCTITTSSSPGAMPYQGRYATSSPSQIIEI